MADNNIEVGKFCCPKCSIDLIYDEKNCKCDYYLGGVKHTDKIIFRRWWIYDYNRVGDFWKFEECWFIRFGYLSETTNVDQYIKEHIEDLKSSLWAEPRELTSYTYYYHNSIKSETEQRYVCYKCSYKGTLWDFIDKEKENAIKTKRNLILAEINKKK